MFSHRHNHHPADFLTIVLRHHAHLPLPSNPRHPPCGASFTSTQSTESWAHVRIDTFLTGVRFVEKHTLQFVFLAILFLVFLHCAVVSVLLGRTLARERHGRHPHHAQLQHDRRLAWPLAFLLAWPIDECPEWRCGRDRVIHARMRGNRRGVAPAGGADSIGLHG